MILSLSGGRLGLLQRAPEEYSSMGNALPEFRKDPITGRWYYFDDRGNRPERLSARERVSKPPQNCPFCPEMKPRPSDGNSGL